MKKDFSICLIFLCFSIAALAQENGNEEHHHGNWQQGQQQQQWQQQSPDDRAKAVVSQLSNKVQVTQQQKDSLQLTFRKFFSDLQTYDVKDNPDVLNQLKTKRDASVKRILADDSKYADYQNFIASMKQHAQGQGNQGDHQDNWHHE